MVENAQLKVEEVYKQLMERDIRINDLDEKNQQITDLYNKLQDDEQQRAWEREEEEERRRLEEEERRRKAALRLKYTPDASDPIDVLFADYINNYHLDIPLQRIGEGHYIFGTKKIFAKKINEKLIIKVGGGYMLADEFFQTYGPIEWEKT